MRDCNKIQEMLSSYIDDYLEPTEKGDLLEHLKGCPECQRELQALQEVVVMFNSLDEEELVPPASFRRELRSKLEKEQRASKVTYIDKATKYFSKSFKSWMPLAAAAILLLVLVPVLTNGFGLIGAKSAKEEAKYDSVAPSAPPRYGSLAGDDSSAKMRMNESVSYDSANGSPEIAFSKDAGPNMLMMEQEQTMADTTGIEQKIIKTGHINLEVDSYKDVNSHIKDMAREMQGYIVSENTHVYDDQRKLLAGSIALRIPQERFDEALDRLENMGSTNNRTVDSQDVTEEYVDVDSRLKAMRMKEERLLSILEKSGTLGDVLAVENELARTRADLEALEGRLRYLSNRSELSNINVTVRETLTPVKQIKTTGLEGIVTRTQEAFIKSINSMIMGFGNLVVDFGAYLPFIIITLISLVILWIIGKKLKNKYINK
ncbi:MAG: hypothetical protein JM58_14765 [Peptococcaceae bacterium BICA1-8]|nr:MAG: hypothetical protein JM58_14765 [Peptococcaceae bacterium BICA1-8]